MEGRSHSHSGLKFALYSIGQVLPYLGAHTIGRSYPLHPSYTPPATPARPEPGLLRPRSDSKGYLAVRWCWRGRWRHASLSLGWLRWRGWLRWVSSLHITFGGDDSFGFGRPGGAIGEEFVFLTLDEGEEFADAAAW